MRHARREQPKTPGHHSSHDIRVTEGGGGEFPAGLPRAARLRCDARFDISLISTVSRLASGRRGDG